MARAVHAESMDWRWRGITGVGGHGLGVAATLGVEHL